LRVTGTRRRRKTVTISAKEIEVFWIVGGAILYFVLIVTLGVMTIRKGHWVIFVIGIFLPFFWLFGAIMPSRRRRRLVGKQTGVPTGNRIL
jgi:ABC-type multidrug transport system permease subunit